MRSMSRRCGPWLRIRVGEGKTLEYKREMPGGPDGGRVRFLKAVSVFANTAGGDLLLGVEAVDGVAAALPGVDLDNPDGETLRLENMIRDGLEPRLPRVEVCPVKIAEHRYVLVVRVPRSWIAPHRVRKNRQFYARNAAGAYPLDVGELRAAFTMSETVAARIRDFRTYRLARIHGRETPVGLGGRAVGRGGDGVPAVGCAVIKRPMRWLRLCVRVSDSAVPRDACRPCGVRPGCPRR